MIYDLAGDDFTFVPAGSVLVMPSGETNVLHQGAYVSDWVLEEMVHAEIKRR